MRGYEESPWLICLDLRDDYLTPEHPLFDPEAVRILPALHLLLDHARSHRWRVVHSLDATRRSAPAAKGLEPKPDEAVFRRYGVSAFTSAHLRTRVETERPACVFLAGFGLGTTGLATLVVGAELGLHMTLIEDAVAATAIGDRSAEEIGRVITAIAPAFATLTTMDALDIDRARIVSLRRGPDDDRYHG